MPKAGLLAQRSINNLKGINYENIIYDFKNMVNRLGDYCADSPEPVQIS